MVPVKGRPRACDYNVGVSPDASLWEPLHCTSLTLSASQCEFNQSPENVQAKNTSPGKRGPFAGRPSYITNEMKVHLHQCGDIDLCSGDRSL